jgi:hypothetical protein
MISPSAAARAGAPWGLILLILFIIIWMALTFTNTLCSPIGLCYKQTCPPPTVCPVCPPAQAPAQAPAPMARAPSNATSGFVPEPYAN